MSRGSDMPVCNSQIHKVMLSSSGLTKLSCSKIALHLMCPVRHRGPQNTHRSHELSHSHDSTRTTSHAMLQGSSHTRTDQHWNVPT